MLKLNKLYRPRMNSGEKRYRIIKVTNTRVYYIMGKIEENSFHPIEKDCASLNRFDQVLMEAEDSAHVENWSDI